MVPARNDAELHLEPVEISQPGEERMLTAERELRRLPGGEFPP
ncbi:MAG: hypothetical protein NTY19_20045 [Planctomycetota bacterium]|nr:hypothetical protein [Planctomycetota bacterium]